VRWDEIIDLVEMDETTFADVDPGLDCEFVDDELGIESGDDDLAWVIRDLESLDDRTPRE
jgi:hypothetical protein